MTSEAASPRSVLITGAGGYIGSQVVAALARTPRSLEHIVACDLRPPQSQDMLPGVTYHEADVRSPEMSRLLKSHRVEVVVHLAAMVTPGKDQDRELLHQVEVVGTENVLQCCLLAGVEKFIYSSSGAAYGYHADNPKLLDEDDALRGNPEFAYSDHKRLVEEMLARWREDHPGLKQLIFRPGTILGATAHNQITALFDGRVVLGLSGAATPFVLIWDQDVVGAIVHGIFSTATGIFNMAGDGFLPMAEMAARMGKPFVRLPVWLVTRALWVLQKLRMTRYGPEQVNFLRYRPVLSNRRLKSEFGYFPQKTTSQVWDYYLESKGHGR